MPTPLIARVECRSEGHAEQVPVAVWLGGTRYPVVEVVEDVTEGPREAGSRLQRKLTVNAQEIGTVRLVRALPDGSWRVFRAD